MLLLRLKLFFYLFLVNFGPNFSPFLVNFITFGHGIMVKINLINLNFTEFWTILNLYFNNNSKLIQEDKSIFTILVNQRPYLSIIMTQKLKK
jgi:hypothetical protein